MNPFIRETLFQFGKGVIVFPRYLYQTQLCQIGFWRYGILYPQHILFIAGLPKSGTTWLKKMLTGYPGFHEALIPDVAKHELSLGRSHDYDLPPDIFSRFKDMLVVTKMHIPGSRHNIDLLTKAGVCHIVLYRDLRDVAVSYFFYVRQTPWHPEYLTYKNLSIQQGLATFAKRTLPAYADWVQTWHKNRDKSLSLEVRYEEMLADPISELSSIAKLFDLDSSPATIQHIVDKHSFKHMSGGRKQGQESVKSFYRKGQAGDWQNHFTPELKATYKERIGDFLIEYGYEKDDSW